MQSLAFTTIIIFIDVVVYAIHWRIARKSAFAANAP